MSHVTHLRSMCYFVTHLYSYVSYLQHICASTALWMVAPYYIGWFHVTELLISSPPWEYYCRCGTGDA